MASLFFFSFLCLVTSSLFAQSIVDQFDRQTYIVRVKAPEDRVFLSKEDANIWYHSFLPINTIERGDLLFTYHNVIRGFAAVLSTDEVKAMEKIEGFVSAKPEAIYSLHTTRSPSFLGLHQNSGLWKGSNYGKGVIIGLLDSGITPNHFSFHDHNVHPPPPKWKGKCTFESGCNNKLIGAMNFIDPSIPPFDDIGHGTHTSSTAAGNFVPGASVLGQANGTAVGIAPHAHVAMYKVCLYYSCKENAIIAAMEKAIEDGVDVISISLGAAISKPFYKDFIAVAAFRAVQNNIFVSCAAGNEGPAKSSVKNDAPWLLTVGASTIDRRIMAVARLGNGEQYGGESVFQPKNFPPKLFPLVYPGSKKPNATFCYRGSLDDQDVRGKIVLCELSSFDMVEEGLAVKEAGGVGMILMNGMTEGYNIIATIHKLPVTHVSYEAGKKIKSYINSTPNPKAAIVFKGTVIGGSSPAPVVTFYSSRGPSLQSPGILKPDIIGPGMNIIAAWPNSIEPKLNFNLESGTSMSCPHLSGVVALLKSANPTWSFAALKSAIMTTADHLNHRKKPIVDEHLQPATMFAIGAGHVNPLKATDPGLVYDLDTDDYIPYLCGLGYKDGQVEKIIGKSVECSKVKKILQNELNYPSFSVDLSVLEKGVFTRTVTNIGQANSTYSATVMMNPAVNVRVDPMILSFSKMNQKITFVVSFQRSNHSLSHLTQAEGSIEWISLTGSHYVRIPIIVKLE